MATRSRCEPLSSVRAAAGADVAQVARARDYLVFDVSDAMSAAFT